ncbi:MAG: AMP-dependent synthetase [Ruminococcaceae bacterium]|nr:AMP-dependent synthetase [Oscillospiraceae bacterium]
MSGKIVYRELRDFASIKELMQTAAKEGGEKLAFRYKKGGKVVDVTYTEFYNTTQALGTALSHRGLTDGHLACIGENSYNWIVAYLTVLQSKGVYIPIDAELPQKDVEHILEEGDATLCFCSNKFETRFKESENKLENIKYFICFDREEDDGKYLSFTKLIEEGKKLLKEGSTQFIEEERDEYKMKLISFTSGTTGLSKGVILSEHNIVSCIKYGLQVAHVYDRTLSVLPYHHTYEAIPGILVELRSTVTICINDSRAATLKNMLLFKPEHIYLVPAFVEVFYKKVWENIEKQGKTALIKNAIKVSRVLRKMGIDVRRKLFKAIHAAFGGELKEIVCGGAPLRAEVAQFFDDIGIIVLNGYGITECSPLVSVNQMQFNDPATVGVKLPCIDIKFEDVNEDGNGEICVKGDTVMLGYYKNEEETKKVLTEDGWFHTGDYGAMNDKGQLLITGRKKNLIVLKNGKNIYPEEIENYIAGISYIKELMVYSIEEDGQEVGLCAEVFLDKAAVEEQGIGDDVMTHLKADVKNACAHLPVYKQISKIVIRDKEFVKTTTNKIKRQDPNNKTLDK